MDWFWFESFGLGCPAFANIFVWREAFESLEATSVVVGIYEVSKVCTKLVMTVIMIARNGGLFDGSVHSLDLPVGPGVLNLGCPVLGAIFVACAAKYMQARDVVLFAVGELDAIVGENGVNCVRNSLDEIGQERSGDHLCRSLVQLDKSKF